MTTYLISGGTGLIGQQLINKLLTSKTHHIYILTRTTHHSDNPQITYINWNEENWQHQVPNIDIVINLAGATLSRYWTKTYKQKMMTSRIQSTRALFDLFSTREKIPSVMFNASAIGYYPPSNTAVYTEETQTSPHDFLSEIVYQWERQANLFNQLRTRVIIGRFGLVLSNQGGAWPSMSLPYRCFIGGKLGNGKQPYSWIHIDDLVNAIVYLIHKPETTGAYNLTAPNPVTQHVLGLQVQQVLKRPHYTRVPKGVLRLFLGEMATLLIDTQYVLPERLMKSEFQFQYPHLTQALEILHHEKKHTART
ncbi:MULTISPECIES: TIGR01777 family oxidoreductase [unclassified Staphylococcus]|uniref:TIGR01777 family oxidoreductase n=1 Tax=unclassified Staphylococcus TaxID=91994 RepID=UPI0021D0485C|nr:MULTISPECIES: TIGR01777 family oxidoreductase [unclassified Staphylococcus]UXR78776.1 TIGR01777 family oxidoreductase [Staphylococcus sp. IVB6227]UXR82936.1 TIGR01777 family oxidoreductase [Staphylococcus sp. IVB6214]